MAKLDLGPAEIIHNDTHYVREATLFAAMNRVEQLTQQRNNLLARLEADPERAAIATLDGLKKILEEDVARTDIADQNAQIFTEAEVYLIGGYLAGRWEVDVDTVPEDIEQAITSVLAGDFRKPDGEDK